MNNFNLTKLIKLYYNLPKGYIIDNPNTLNFVCKIFDICDVYISNKALKHIVESRRDKDFLGLDEIITIIKSFENILLNPDIIFINEKSINSIGVSKKVSGSSEVNIVVILEYIPTGNHYDIITSFERNDKKINKFINIKHLIK